MSLRAPKLRECSRNEFMLLLTPLRILQEEKGIHLFSCGKELSHSRCFNLGQDRGAEIVGDRIVRPIFIDLSLTGQKYLKLMRGDLVPALAVLFSNHRDLDIPNEDLWFQQDGAPSYYSRILRDY
ncbi:hypothetical protein NQ317_001484 [Molorchus minor]|uniref:Uncharacterized protein n=1 Tax=Molorchus minor TaxID=1323400 RepID=A0ABQ9IUW4_9CUCU|nr:hypothetical protein NQ317_001484 [Molorchus minor]